MITELHKKNRITIMVIFTLAIVPFMLAWYFAKHPELLNIGKSNGDLIVPIVLTEATDFNGFDAFTTENLKELAGHWVLINVITSQHCNEQCLNAIYKSQQISLMMGKDITRVRRAAIILYKANYDASSLLAHPDERLLKILVSEGLQKKIEKLIGNSQADDRLLIMDPLGNLMMQYPSDYDPYKVKSDLSKLLKISQIG